MTRQNTFYEMLKTGEFAGMVRETTRKRQINNSAELYNILYPLAQQDPSHEQFQIVYLDTRNRVLHIETALKGSLNAASVYLREIVRAALGHNAAAVIAAHNHPSDDPEPSRDLCQPGRKEHR